MSLLLQIYKEDLDELVELILAMPDGERKFAFIQETVKSLKVLKTITTINSHFIILSSLFGPHLQAHSPQEQ